MLAPGEVLIAPPNQHLLVPARGRVQLRGGEPVGGHIPSASLLLESAAKAYGRRAVGMILTGMGVDGADGMLAGFNGNGPPGTLTGGVSETALTALIQDWPFTLNS